MPRGYSDAAKTGIYATSARAEDVPSLLLVIRHPGLAEPVRAVMKEDEPFVHKGDTFPALNFDARLPEDLETGEPRATLEVDNVGRELVQWLEVSRGGEGATAEFIQARRADPDTVEWNVIMDLENVEIDPLKVSGELMFDTLVNKPGIAVRHDPETAPGIF